MTDTPHEPGALGEVFERTPGEGEALTPEDELAVIRRLGSLMLDQDTVLRAHQQEAFNATTDFYAGGNRSGYVKIPTGGGKTVLFVELARQQIEAAAAEGERSRVLVLAPTKNLVRQAVGSINDETGKRRGFAGFAPDLEVRGYTSDISQKQRTENMLEAEVLVTTYSSFRSMIKKFVEASGYEPGELERQISELEASFPALKANADAERRGWSEYVATTVMTERAEAALAYAHHQLGGSERIGARRRMALEQMRAGLEDESVGLVEKQKIIKKLMRHALSEDALTLLRWKREFYAAIGQQNRRRAAARNSGEALTDVQLREFGLEMDRIGDILPEDKIDLSDAEAEAVDLLYKMTRKQSIGQSDIQSIPARNQAYRRSESAKDAVSLHRAAHNRAKALRDIQQASEALAQYDLLICDEVHRSIGSKTWEAISEFTKRRDIAVFGATATDQYHDRSVADYVGPKIYDLTQPEAIAERIVNPMAFFVHDTNLRFQNIELDPDGDYSSGSMREMRFSDERNQIGIDYAKMLSEAGYNGLMSAIAGGVGQHAVDLAEKLNKTLMTDPVTGEVRFMRARYIVGERTSSEQEEEYFAALEAGEIDWITFVDAVREGVDLDNAKALINMRPTRSPLLATQRAGRVSRIFPGALTSIVVDLFDGIEGVEDELMQQIPPVVGIDMFGLEEAEQGITIGEVNPESVAIIEALKQAMPNPEIIGHYSKYRRLLDSIMKITASGKGRPGAKTVEGRDGNWHTYRALQNQFKGFLPRDVLLEASMAEPPLVGTNRGQMSDRIMPLFDLDDIIQLHPSKPEVNPNKLHIDDKGVRWITPEGCVQMLSNRFPGIMAHEISDAIARIGEVDELPFSQETGRVRIDFRPDAVVPFGFTRMYRHDEILERLVPSLEGAGTLIEQYQHTQE